MKLLLVLAAKGESVANVLLPTNIPDDFGVCDSYYIFYYTIIVITRNRIL